MKVEDIHDYWRKAQDATVVHCPFCGAMQGADNAHWWGVRCRNCGATGPCHPPRREKGYSQEVDDAFDPIAAWNRRWQPGSHDVMKYYQDEEAERE